MLSCPAGKMPTPHLFTFPSDQVVAKAAENIGDLVLEKLREERAITLFLSGGSAIEMYRELFSYIGTQLDSKRQVKISIALVDERYGPYGHADSNEQQLREKGVTEQVIKLGAQFVGMLPTKNSSPHETLLYANQQYSSLFANDEYSFALLGLGEDGHTAGWLPTQTEEKFFTIYKSSEPVVYYEIDPADSANPFLQRLTISTTVVPKIDQVIVYTKGSSKKTALRHLMLSDTPLHQTPALALYQTSRPTMIITDQEYTPKN
jgi:6-phosphogluconolactonase/glucosamine-6-phosphate isomerase/deaminase